VLVNLLLQYLRPLFHLLVFLLVSVCLCVCVLCVMQQVGHYSLMLTANNMKICSHLTATIPMLADDLPSLGSLGGGLTIWQSCLGENNNPLVVFGAISPHTHKQRRTFTEWSHSLKRWRRNQLNCRCGASHRERHRGLHTSKAHKVRIRTLGQRFAGHKVSDRSIGLASCLLSCLLACLLLLLCLCLCSCRSVPSELPVPCLVSSGESQSRDMFTYESGHSRPRARPRRCSGAKLEGQASGSRDECAAASTRRHPAQGIGHQRAGATMRRSLSSPSSSASSCGASPFSLLASRSPMALEAPLALPVGTSSCLLLLTHTHTHTGASSAPLRPMWLPLGSGIRVQVSVRGPAELKLKRQSAGLCPPA